MFKWFFISSILLFTLSCKTVQKQDKNNLVGAESSDIFSKDIDTDSRGSDSGTIEGLGTVYFAHDTSTLSEESRAVLVSNVDWINSHTEVQAIDLEGHCDQTGSEAYNIGLGLRRAEAVKNFLMEQGVSADKFAVISYGEERLFSEIDNDKNRRVNFVPQY